LHEKEIGGYPEAIQQHAGAKLQLYTVFRSRVILRRCGTLKPCSCWVRIRSSSGKTLVVVVWAEQSSPSLEETKGNWTGLRRESETASGKSENNVEESESRSEEKLRKK
jgi:hypothetical protein